MRFKSTLFGKVVLVKLVEMEYRRSDILGVTKTKLPLSLPTCVTNSADNAAIASKKQLLVDLICLSTSLIGYCNLFRWVHYSKEIS